MKAGFARRLSAIWRARALWRAQPYCAPAYLQWSGIQGVTLWVLGYGLRLTIGWWWQDGRRKGLRQIAVVVLDFYSPAFVRAVLYERQF